MTDNAEESSETDRNHARFKINTVSELTGISQDVLRMWERRYAAVTPVRSPGGTRLYSDVDIWRFTLLRQGVAKGHQIGRIVKLSNEELERLGKKSPPRPDPADPYDAVVNKFIDQISKMDLDSAQAELDAAAKAFPTRELMEKVFTPLLAEIGNHWQHGDFGVAEEHLASNMLRSVLLNLNGMNREGEPVAAIVLATPAGERHEFGLMLSAVYAVLRNWRVVYLGLETPAEEIARTVRLTASGVVGLSLAAPFSELTASELTKLHAFLPKKTAVILGGAGAVNYQDSAQAFGWKLVSSFDAFDDYPS